MKEEKTYHTFRNLNKPLYFKGLTPFQILLGGMITIISFVVVKLFAFLVLIVIFLVARKIAKSNKRGNPKVLDSWMVHLSTKRQFLDKRRLFKHLNKHVHRPSQSISNTGGS